MKNKKINPFAVISEIAILLIVFGSAMYSVICGDIDSDIYSWNEIVGAYESDVDHVIITRVEAVTDVEIEELFSVCEMSSEDEQREQLYQKYRIFNRSTTYGSRNYYEFFDFKQIYDTSERKNLPPYYSYYFSSDGELIFKLTDWGASGYLTLKAGDEIREYIYFPQENKFPE